MGAGGDGGLADAGHRHIPKSATESSVCLDPGASAVPGTGPAGLGWQLCVVFTRPCIVRMAQVTLAFANGSV